MIGNICEIIIEKPAAETAMAQRLALWARQNNIPCYFEDSASRIHAASDIVVGPSKLSLRVVRHAGAALKPCTGRTDSLLCCNLRVVTQTVGCPLNCSYCILQDYQNRAQITLFADGDEILAKVGEELRATERRFIRVCTGQVGDSLALEPEVGFAKEAVEFFSRIPNAVLELKTKTAAVEFLLSLAHQGRTIVSWTLSPPNITEHEELGCATFAQRLAAARRVVEAGYLVAFHFDPLIAIGDDEEQFLDAIEEALKAIDLTRLAYVSLGTVRFLPAMRRTILSRFPQSRVTLGELLPDVDGKLRLLRPLRIALYQKLVERIKKLAPLTFVYFCMEPPRVWKEVLGVSWQTRNEVEWAMASNLIERFGLMPQAPQLSDYQVD